MPRRVLVVVMCLGASAAGQILADPTLQKPVDYSGHKLVRVNVTNAEELDQLRSISPDIWNCHLRIGPLDARIPPARMDALEASGLSFEVVSEDIGPATRRHLLRQGVTAPFDDYLPFDEIIDFTSNLAGTRPDLCTLIDIGDSIEGRDLWVLRIRGAGSGPKPAVFYHGLQHAREWITGPMVMYIAEQLVDGYGQDACITELVDAVDFYLAPCVNPDGYVHTWSSERLWRKNRRDNGDGTFGVDLNRNWGFEWGGPGASADPGDNLYFGTGPFSEPETQALSNFILAHPNIVAHMDYHSYSQLILWPWGYQCATPPAPDDATFAALGGAMQGLIESVHGLVYEPGPACNTLYQVSGGSIDWAYGAAGAFSFTIELRPFSSAPGFLLPPEQIRPTVEENLPAILHLSKWAGGFALDGRLAPPATATAEAGRPFAVQARVYPLAEAIAPQGAQLFYRFVEDGAWASVPMDQVGDDRFEAAVPATSCLSHINYYVSALGNGGSILSLPCSGAAAPVSVTVEQVSDRFADDFQFDRGWTTEVLGATTGMWQRGVPIDDPNWDYDPATDGDGSGQCWLTENLNNPAYADPSNTDVDGGAVRLTSPPLDLTGPDVRVQYFYFLRVTNPAGVDRLLVEADAGGGAGPWVEVARHEVDTGLGWQQQILTISDFAAAGIDRTATTRLRFTANDDAPASIVEAGVDGFRVVEVNCQPLIGDANGNGVLDAEDHAALASCLGGDGQPVPSTCLQNVLVFDADQDGDVDLADVSAIQRAATP